jgi:hypothetical protein
LGKGQKGIVYLYKTKDEIPLKLAVKASLKNNWISKKSIINELKTFKKISDIFKVHQKDCAPKFLGETFFDDINVIKMEFINQSIEEAIKDYSKPLSLKDALIGMFDAV